MSIRHPNDYDLHLAGLAGMDSRIDPTVAEDLGIPSTPETYASHLASAAVAAEVAISIDAKRQAARAADHVAHARNNHLSGVMTPAEAAIQQAINDNRPVMPWENPKAG